MAEFNAEQYNAITVSEDKIAPSYQNARKKVVLDKYTFTANVISIGDEILFSKIPESAIITNAKIFIPASLGTTGVFSMGLKAHVDLDGATVAEDNDSLVDGADGGGQAAVKESTLACVGLYKKIGKGGAQPFLYCDEATDAANGLDIWMEVEYALP